jgi:hypothetical protein
LAFESTGIFNSPTGLFAIDLHNYSRFLLAGPIGQFLKQRLHTSTVGGQFFDRQTIGSSVTHHGHARFRSDDGVIWIQYLGRR